MKNEEEQTCGKNGNTGTTGGSPPFFSICMPVYQGAAFIEKAINSLMRQTYRDWELIIVDNASTDGTWEILQSKAERDARIRVSRNEQNLGLSGNWNTCLRMATGQWIGTLAADDVYRPVALKTIADAVQDCQPILWMHAHEAVHSSERRDLVRPYNEEKSFETRDLAELFYLKGNLFGEISCYFVNREALARTHCWVVADNGTADLDLWFRITLANPDRRALYCPDVLTETTIHEESDSSRYIRSGRNWVDIFAFIERYSSLSWSLAVRLKSVLRILHCLLRYSAGFSPENRRSILRSSWNIWRNLLLPPFRLHHEYP